jgi:hypothetical protein
MVENPHFQRKKAFVMPAQAGNHLRAPCKARENLDSGPGSSPGQALRRNDDKEEPTSSLRIQNPSALSRVSFPRFFKELHLSAAAKV